MNRPRTRMLAVAAMLAIAGSLAGCTQERAMALKAAAERFAVQAASAIDATIDLHLRAAYGPQLSDDVMLAKAREDVFTVQSKDPSQLDKAVDVAFRWVNEREEFRRNSFGQADQLKQAYNEFALAFRRLPEGSLFAARDVACAAGLGARLVRYMADSARTLQTAPVPYAKELAVSTTQVTSVAATAVRDRNSLTLDAPLRSHLVVLREQGRANAEVVAKLTDAAESGIAVLDMIEKYNDVSAADLASAVRQVLVIRESTFGLSSAAQLERLDKVVARINAKPALAQAANLPINTRPADCP